MGHMVFREKRGLNKGVIILHFCIKLRHIIFLATRRYFTLNFLSNKCILDRLACRQLLVIDYAHCCDSEHGHLGLIKPNVPTLKTLFGQKFGI